ncbi:MAG: galactokinase [Oscillospiraceae bacterium]|nr:galactokinase [Oscillospiraceae bacterium]
MELAILAENLKNGVYNEKLRKLYGDNKIESAKARYLKAVENFESLYGNRDIEIISVPGRSEILGNHTDHNHGCVLAAAINLDVIAVVSKSLIPGGRKSHIRIQSEGFDPDDVDISNTENLASAEREKFTSSAIIRGTCNRFVELGHEIGGFDAYTVSDVLKGSGLSSSAAFEILVGFILNYLYNEDKITPLEIAQIGQYAENNYFGKPCGLMDQTACSVGGFVAIDFKNPAEPAVEKLDFDLTKSGYSLCIVSPGGSHDNLNQEYADIRKEMEQVAAYFGKEVLRDVDKAEFNNNIDKLRQLYGDRAILRSMHYFAENIRVRAGADALKDGNFEGFLQLITSSGNSSFKYLQNLYVPKEPQSQGLPLALALSEEILVNKQAAARVHGGGFAGTIQAFIPKRFVGEYFEKIRPIFGEDSCLELFVRNDGAVVVM